MISWKNRQNHSYRWFFSRTKVSGDLLLVYEFGSKNLSWWAGLVPKSLNFPSEILYSTNHPHMKNTHLKRWVFFMFWRFSLLQFSVLFPRDSSSCRPLFQSSWNLKTAHQMRYWYTNFSSLLMTRVHLDDLVVAFTWWAGSIRLAEAWQMVCPHLGGPCLGEKACERAGVNST